MTDKKKSVKIRVKVKEICHIDTEWEATEQEARNIKAIAQSGDWNAVGKSVAGTEPESSEIDGDSLELFINGEQVWEDDDDD